MSCALGKSKDIVEKLFSLGLLKIKNVAELEKASSESGRDVIEEAMVTGRVSPDALLYVISENLDIPFIVLQEGDVDSSLSALIPYEIAWGEEVVPLSEGDDFVTVGVYDPLRPKLFRRIEKLTGKKARVALVGRDSIRRMLMFLYPPPIAISDKIISGHIAGDISLPKFLATGDSTSLLSEILFQSRTAGMRVLILHHVSGKFVIEGREDSRSTVLLETPGKIGEFLFDGLKKLCGFRDGDPAVRGRIIETGEGKRSGMYKVALVSGAGSKKAVIRIIPNALGKLSIDALGFGEDQFQALTGLIRREKGIYIIGSPTLDGVSTTLYSMVRFAKSPNSAVVTIEEDIRFKNEGFIQLEKPMLEEDLSIEKIVRTLSPDILMYSNLTIDKLIYETAHIYPSRVSVFAGIECKSLESAVEKVITSEASRHVLASLMKAVVFQKLVRILCDACKKELPAIPSMYLDPGMVESGKRDLLARMKYYIPSGCDECGGSGFSGMTAIFDMVVFTPSVRMEMLMDKREEEKREKILCHFRLGPVELIVKMLMEGQVTFEDIVPFLDLIREKSEGG